VHVNAVVQQHQQRAASRRVQRPARICSTTCASAKTSYRRYWNWRPTSRQRLSRMLKH